MAIHIRCFGKAGVWQVPIRQQRVGAFVGCGLSIFVGRRAHEVLVIGSTTFARMGGAHGCFAWSVPAPGSRRRYVHL